MEIHQKINQRNRMIEIDDGWRMNENSAPAVAIVPEVKTSSDIGANASPGPTFSLSGVDHFS